MTPSQKLPKVTKRQRILDAAESLFAANGYEAATIAKVADRAGVAVGTVFQYARSKPELLLMAAYPTWVTAVSYGRAAAASTVDPLEAIALLIKPVIDMYEFLPGPGQIFARELLFGAPGYHRDRILESVADLEEGVALTLISAGCSVPRAQAAGRAIIWGVLVEQAGAHNLAGAPMLPAAERITALTELIVNGALGERRSR